MNIKKTLVFSKRLVEMIEELQSKRGFLSFSATVHSCIAEVYSRAFPAYSIGITKETPEEKLQRKEKEKEAKINMEKDKLREIVRQLGGQTVIDKGTEFAVYYTYAGKKRYEQKTPLTMISSDILRTQYQPNRETVERYQAEGKSEY